MEQAKRFKAEAEHELHVVNDMLMQVQRAHERYQRKAQRLTELLRTDLPQSVTLLKHKVAILRSTLDGSSLGGAGLPGLSDPDVAATAATLVSAGLAVAGVMGAISHAFNPGRSDGAEHEWIEQGIQLVPLDQIDLHDSYVQGPSDYKKVSYTTMVEGVRRFAEIVLPAVRNGAKTSLLPLKLLDVAQYLDVQAPDDIRIKGHRIGIEHIVHYYNEGYSPEQIADTFPGVDLKIIYTIIAYYLHHRREVDAYIAHLDADAEAARRQWAAHRSPASLRVEAILKERWQRQDIS